MMLEIFFKVESWMIGVCGLIVAVVIVIGGLLYVMNTPDDNSDDINHFF